MVGSISHGASLAVAAVARQCTHAGIGIDVEPIVDAQTYADVAGDVASMQELAVLRTALGALTNEALWTLVFSAKESVYKCLFPQTLRFMEFEDLRLIAVEPGAPAPRIRFRLERELSRSHPLGALFEASFHVGDSRVQTAVLDLPRR
jgi:4'-phosphopantetheinyl transferase EntD